MVDKPTHFPTTQPGGVSLKPLPQVLLDRRATSHFLPDPVPDEYLDAILRLGTQAPSGYNLQPWRFIVVQSPEQKKRLRSASYNQGKVEEASAVIVACGDADGWRKDLDLMLQLGRKGGMSESYAAQARSSVPNYLSSFSALSITPSVGSIKLYASE